MRSLWAGYTCFFLAVLCPAQTPTQRPSDTSGISVDALSQVQITNLYILGKVWGFLKYHHPAVTAGDRDWDRDLFHVMPGVLAAPDQAAAEQVIFRWVTDLGETCPGPCIRS